MQDFNVIGDVFPERVDLSVNMEVNFENTNWWGLYGHSIPSQWALYSPKLKIITGDDKVRYFTLLMIDAGRFYFAF